MGKRSTRMGSEMLPPHGVVQLEPLYPAQGIRPYHEHGSGTETVVGKVPEHTYPPGLVLEQGGILEQTAVQILAQFVAADHPDIGHGIEVIKTLPEPAGTFQQRVHQKITPSVVPHVQTVDALPVAFALGMELEHIVVGRQVGILYHLDERPHVVADVPDLDEPCIGLEMLQAAQRRGFRDIGHDKVPVAAVYVP